MQKWMDAINAGINEIKGTEKGSSPSTSTSEVSNGAISESGHANKVPTILFLAHRCIRIVSCIIQNFSSKPILTLTFVQTTNETEEKKQEEPRAKVNDFQSLKVIGKGSFGKVCKQLYLSFLFAISHKILYQRNI